MFALIKNCLKTDCAQYLGKALILCVITACVTVDWIDYDRNNTADASAGLCSTYNPVLCAISITETQTVSSTALFSLGVIFCLGGQQLAVYRILNNLFWPQGGVKMRAGWCSRPNRFLAAIHLPALAMLTAASLTFTGPIAHSIRRPQTIRYAVFDISGVTYECIVCLLTVGSAVIIYLTFAIAVALLHSFCAANRRLNQGFAAVRGAVTDGDIDLLKIVRQFRNDHRQLLTLYEKLECYLGTTIATGLFAAILSVAQTVASIMQNYNSFASPLYTTAVVLRNLFYTWMVLALVASAERASKEMSKTVVAWSALRDQYWITRYNPSGGPEVIPRRRESTTCHVINAANNHNESAGYFQHISKEIGAAIKDTQLQFRTFYACGIMPVNYILIAQVVMMSIMIVFFLWDRKEGYIGNAQINSSTSIITNGSGLP